MHCSRYYIALLTAVLMIVCIWSKESCAEESTFDVRLNNTSAGHAEAVLSFLDKKEQIYLKKILTSQNQAGSKKPDKNQTALLKEKGLDLLLKMQDVKAQIMCAGRSENGGKQIQGIQRLLYILLLTNNDASGNGLSNVSESNRKNITYLRYQTVILTSDNVIKLVKLKEGRYEKVSVTEKAKKMFKEILNDMNTLERAYRNVQL